MKIIGLEGMTVEELNDELERGAKFVIYEYCISIIILTFKQPSNIYFIRAGQSRVTPGLGCSLVSMLFGWWGFPWGLIYTIGALAENFSGGRNVTREVIASLQEQ